MIKPGRRTQLPSGKCGIAFAPKPRLPGTGWRCLMNARASLRDFFAGLAEYTFESRLGVADPPLVDYLAELLARFIRSDAIYAVRSPVGGRLAQVTSMRAEAESRV